ncbi:type VII secretion-associated serine protease mycosin [Streptomyces olivaceiscleroticus]|uniref:Type VII secretion-associated serine protease mycosin n=1 Tax=Streptomyces olivaceiscleroticus TaxID=68245 RepID=A0ABP3K7Q7_9ACTN
MTRARRALAAALTATAVATLAAPPAHADGIRTQEWALDALHVDDAWRTTKGDGITVAVLDTGVDATHPDLKGQVLPGKDLIGFGAARGDKTWADHGTAMSGIIAGHGHGKDDADGVLGIAPEAKILPVRVILEDADPQRKRARTERANALADGIRWAADHGADVINLSLGDDSDSAHPEPREDAAVQYALAKGIPVVASAGNGGEHGDHVSYPAAYPGVIAATAVDKYGTRAPFSTRRWYATVSAPGVNVVIANPDRKYYEGWGTSAAAAYVSGAVALVRAAHPTLEPDQIKQLLTETASDSPPHGRNDDLGAGLVNPAAAIKKGAPTNQTSDSRTTHTKRYFGPGPTAQAATDTSWLPWTAAIAGTALLATGTLLHRRRT